MPPGPNATDGTTWRDVSEKVAACVTVLVFQRSVRPLFPPAARMPPGPNATENTPSWLGAVRVAPGFLVAVFQRCTRPVRSPMARVPSGPNAIDDAARLVGPERVAATDPVADETVAGCLLSTKTPRPAARPATVTAPAMATTS